MENDKINISSKTLREDLKKLHGFIHPNSIISSKFLEKHGQKHKDSGLFRKTWSTWKNAMEKIAQRELRF